MFHSDAAEQPFSAASFCCVRARGRERVNKVEVAPVVCNIPCNNALHPEPRSRMFTFAEIQRIFFFRCFILQAHERAHLRPLMKLHGISFFSILLWKAWSDKNRRSISFRIFLGHLLHHCQSACLQIYVRCAWRRKKRCFVCESLCFVLQHSLSLLWPEMMMKIFVITYYCQFAEACAIWESGAHIHCASAPRAVAKHHSQKGNGVITQKTNINKFQKYKLCSH